MRRDHPATTILGSSGTTRRPRQASRRWQAPADGGLTALPKRLVIDLDSPPDMPDKIEGVALIDRNTLAVINDNDFDINNGSFDAAGRFTGPEVRSEGAHDPPGQPAAAGQHGHPKLAATHGR